MIRSLLLRRSVSSVLSCSRGSCLLTGRTAPGLRPRSPGNHPIIHQNFHRPIIPTITSSLIRYSDLSAQKYTLIYRLPHIKLLRAVSRMKLIQTAITAIILPPVYVLYLQGSVSFFLACYSTGVAVFAGAMLYIASYFFRRVVGMMYLDESQSTLKVSHLTFWGKRNDIYLPLSDVMTISDTGDAISETIMKLKRYSSAETLYFSTRFGLIVDHHGFQKVFGSIN